MITVGSRNDNKILTKEKIDRQLSGQPSTTVPFMKVCDSHNTTKKRPVSFKMQDRLDVKIDKLTLIMSKPTAQGNAQGK